MFLPNPNVSDGILGYGIFERESFVSDKGQISLNSSAYRQTVSVCYRVDHIAYNFNTCYIETDFISKH